LVIDGMFSRSLSSNYSRSGAAVNRRVVGSSPTSGARFFKQIEAVGNGRLYLCDRYVTQNSTSLLRGAGQCRQDNVDRIDHSDDVLKAKSRPLKVSKWEMP